MTALAASRTLVLLVVVLVLAIGRATRVFGAEGVGRHLLRPARSRVEKGALHVGNHR